MKLTKIADTVADWLAPTRRALADVEQAVEAKAGAYEAERQAGIRIAAQAPAFSDLDEAVNTTVAALGSSWLPRTTLPAALCGTPIVGPDGGLSVERFVTVEGLLGGTVSWPALCALFPSIVKEAFSSMLRREVVDPGPPLADRPRLLAESNERADALARQHEALVDAAHGLGLLRLQHLEVTEAKRLQARQRREREERSARERTPRHGG